MSITIDYPSEWVASEGHISIPLLIWCFHCAQDRDGDRHGWWQHVAVLGWQACGADGMVLIGDVVVCYGG